MYKIEKNVPIAKLASKKPKYPFEQMEVNDSFFVKGDKKKKAAVCVAIYYYKKENPDVKFCTRTNDEGIRVWRTQ